MTSTDDKAAPPRRPRLIMLLPLFVFVALAAGFLIRLETGGNPDAIPSALIGRPAPDFDLPPLEGVARPGLARADLEGGVTVVNVFASWCGPCRIEHPQLMELAKDDGINLVAINYKDQPGNARRFLTDLGNPYAAIGVDPNGRAGIDWGLYGVPETFIIDATGTIRYKHIGPIGEDTLAEVIRPEIEKAMQPEG
ncbi:MAG: DsbE family thiol:disulfide interchange protein [Bauldia litoralis]|uniref:DsbE family thiol:disulfide interchange protein n=1 Tax=Bauldia litoralis TaxID=665467 RepID=UPI003298C448